MDNFINFGIDLGTTNSAIAKFIKGEVKVFRNPNGWADTTPSVVGFRKDKILVGDQAKTFSEREPKNVISTFKRRMGTTECYSIEHLNESKTPIELSAFVLKELKTLVTTGEKIESIVITVPASFDLIQSNATTKAGYDAGFKQVILLQEPIAASLAYANMLKSSQQKDGQWLVYDLGGGTFDVALIKIVGSEMKVLDHKGNNYLGGADFDRLIVEKIIIPELEKKFIFNELQKNMQSASGKYNAKYLTLLHRAEEAKKTLSTKTATEIIIDGFEDDEDNEVDIELTITRSEFNELIKSYLDETIQLIKEILVQNSLRPTDLEFTLMVGGSTYIPYVKTRVEEILGIPPNCETDPTTAVVIGAAYYAATQKKELTEIQKEKNYKLSIRAAYANSSKEKEELFAARVSGNIEGLFYRIMRKDGGYNSGLKKLTEKINDDLPLIEDVYNEFTLIVYDAESNIIDTGFETFAINSKGGITISGQPLMEDISLEVDDPENEGQTKLYPLFYRNTDLPNKKKVTKTLNKLIIKGSKEQVLRINILQGSHTAMPESNKSIGYFEITGLQLIRDIVPGSDIEITVEVSQSLTLTISAYINMADQEFKEIFNPTIRNTSVKLLKYQVKTLSKKLDYEIDEATKKEDYETAAALKKQVEEMKAVENEVENLTIDDITDKKFPLEDKKRKIAQEIDNATKDKQIQLAKASYFKTKETCNQMIDENGNDYERNVFKNIESNEGTFLTSNSPARIQEKIDDLNKIESQIRWRTPQHLIDVFNWLKSEQPKMRDTTQAKSLIDAGKFAIESENWDRLKEIDYDLIDLLPDNDRKSVETKIGWF